MKTSSRRSSAKRARGPSPAHAGANLLVHDLKNLAGRLSALCQNLQDKYEDPLFKRSALGVLDDTVDHLKRLATDLRDHEGAVMVKLHVDLNQVLEASLLDTRPDLAEKIDLRTAFAELPAIWGDSFLLREAFSCAIENALEALAGRGSLGLFTSTTGRRGRRSVVVEIADTGPGMSGQFVRQRLFQPFCSTKRNGLGLGVYTMAQVASIHGGTVRILSGEGAGTRVRFRFPVEEA